MRHLLIILTAVWICSADGVPIKGIVLDKNGSGIPQATIKLQPLGITVTTGNDGRFSFTANALNDRYQRTGMPSHYKPSILHGHMIINLDRQSEVEITAFTIRGQIIETIKKVIDAGPHSIAMPSRGTNVYIYRVKTENDIYTFKNAIFRQNGSKTQDISTPSFEGQSNPSTFAKKVTNEAAADYTLELTKDGYVDYTVTVSSSDRREIEIRPARSIGSVADADGNVYQLIQIGNQIWTASNLRTTKFYDGEPIPYVPDTADWGQFNIYETVTVEGTTRGPHDPSPQFCYYNNTGNTDTIELFGALYNWVAVNTGKLAPQGFHVPDTTDWLELYDYLVAHLPHSDSLSNENLLAKELAAGTYWNPSTMPGAVGNDYVVNNGTGFAAMPAGWRTASSQILYLASGDMAYWWSRQEEFPNIVRCFTISNYGQTGQVFWKTIWPIDVGLSVRLVKDK
jgi:uncharacterized protein (TIGR02145 family)